MRLPLGHRVIAWILFLGCAGTAPAKEPALIWQTRVPIVLKDDGDHHLLSLRLADGSLLIVTSSETNVSPRIVSPEGQVVARSEIPSGQALWDVALDPWGGVTIQGNLCDSCSGDVLKYDARTGLPRWPAAFRGESRGLLGVTPAGDVIRSNVREDGCPGRSDGRSPLERSGRHFPDRLDQHPRFRNPIRHGGRARGLFAPDREWPRELEGPRTVRASHDHGVLYDSFRYLSSD
jgi:hypothetical protein